ncbi:PR domain zinc finger protein 15-like [Phlebotomus papatasi]|uniref:PR domain zinc finger protein 15-like n=1 Tax=Phlebotomus papatasi TaxID=29031 RepID=UPI0024842D19|nr:PR domain zinc finger protein 15-like [Phlebotomus papatasi]
MEKSVASQCILCAKKIRAFLSEVIVNECVWAVRDMLHAFSTKLDENHPQNDVILCESCAMELAQAFEFLLKIQKAEDLLKIQEAIEVPDEEEMVTESEVPELEESDFNMDAFIEKIPEPVAPPKPKATPPQKKQKEPFDGVIHIEEIDYPSRVVIFPQFVVCPAETKKLLSDVASGRISEEFLQRRNNLKMLDVTGMMISLNNHHGVLQHELVESEHDKDDMYLCRYCPKSFTTAHHLMMHTRKSHMCQFCLLGFAKVDDLHVHIEQDHHRFECHFCPREFSCNNNLRMHLKKRHGIALPAYVSLITVEKQEEAIGRESVLPKAQEEAQKS